MDPLLADRVLAGERLAVARAVRLADDRHPASRPLLHRLYPRLAHCEVLGVTGTPGAGKSTLVDRLIEAYRARGRRVGVAAIDPSSPFTGGALLGDRIRMQRHAADDGVFIRSLATRGHLGGLSASTLDVLAVLGAAGFSTLLLETVGVGQDEVEVSRVADTVLLVVQPGGGDSVQALKAGVMEIAHVFVVNKADLPGAERTARDIEQMLALADAGIRGSLHAAHRWTPPVVLASTLEDRNLDAVLEAVDLHRQHLERSGEGRVRRTLRARTALLDVLRERIDAALAERRPGDLEAAVNRIAAGEGDPHGEADRILRDLLRDA